MKKEGIRQISVIGLGKLGLCMACVFATKYKVRGIDIDEKKLRQLYIRESPIEETGLQDLFDSVGENITFDDDYGEVLHTDITFVIVPTPSEEDDSFYDGYVVGVVEELNKVLKRKKHMIVISSTVMPGTIEKLQKIVSSRVEIVYNPEFIALGSVIHDFQNPDIILVGTDNIDVRCLIDIYRKVCKNEPYFITMKSKEAEIAKLSLNCYITMKITFANMMYQLCNKAGVNAHRVCNGIGFDSRIGNKYLKPGMGYGGPCFPRDNKALVKYATDNGVALNLLRVVDDTNKDHWKMFVKMFLTKWYANVAILGLAYKCGTHITEESQALKIYDYLIEFGHKVNVYDPHVKMLGSYKTAQECVDASDVVLVCLPYPEFKKVDYKDKKVIDIWRCL